MRASALSALVAIASIVVATSCIQSDDPTGIVDGPSRPVAAVAVKPTQASIIVGSHLDVDATPNDDRGNAVANRRVRWSSSDPSVASVTETGDVTAHKPGTAAIVASSDFKFGVSSITVIRIPVATVLVVPQSATLVEQDSLQLAAEVLDAGSQPLLDRTVVWSSANPALATVSQDGIVTAHSTGSTRITATADGVSGSMSLIISPVPVATVDVVPTTLTITRGQSAQIIATPRDSGGRVLTGRPVTWASSNSNIASVSASGLVTAVAVGTAAVTATSEGRSASVNVTVQPPALSSMYLTPSSVTRLVGQSVTISAVFIDASGNVVPGSPVTWTTSDAGVAAVSSSGVVTAIAAGTATITGTSSGLTAAAFVTVIQEPVARVDLTPASANLVAGQTMQLTATPRSASGQALNGRPVSWSSSNTSVATVSGGGLVTAIAAGTASISATSEGQSASATVTVTIPPVASVTIVPASASIQAGNAVLLSAVTRDAAGAILTGRVITWSTSNPQVATVSGGYVVAVSAGTATITATSEGRSATAVVTVTQPTVIVAAVTVTPSVVNLNVGQTATVSAVPVDSNGAVVPGVTVTWASASPAVATVSANGTITGQGAGTTVITATAQGQSATVSVTVVNTLPPPPTNAPELPRVFLNTAYIQPTGSTISVAAGGNLQQAINSANAGDVIVLQAGATFTGNFTLPVKPGSGWVTIRTSTSDATIPEGSRVTAIRASLLPKIVSPNSSPAIQTAPGAHHYRLVGLEISASSSVNTMGYLVGLGDGSSVQNSMSQVPHNLIVDRSYIHANSGLDIRRCIALNSASTSIIDSYIGECHSNNGDAQAIVGWNGPGPYKIVNNYLEGSGENVMFGGADPAINGLVPSDIEIRRNHFVKPMSWKGAWVAKNLLELKSAQRILIEGNLLENSWVDGQIGFAVVMWSVNQSGRCTWCVTQDVTFRYNRINNVNHGFQLNYKKTTTASIVMQRVLIAHNVLTNVGAPALGGSGGRLYQMNGPIIDLTIEHNTAFAPLQQFSFVDPTPRVLPGLLLRNNIGGAQYNVFSSAGQGATALQLYGGPNYQFLRNVVVGGTSPPPPNNSFPSSTAAVGFVNYSGGDFRLSASSAYRGGATDGTDPGADINGLNSRIQGVIVP